MDITHLMMTFEKSKGRPLYEQVREHLRQVCLQHSIDTALPSLRQLSESFGVNHITISRAMRELEGEGVLRIVPGKGTFVANHDTAEQCIEMISLLTQRMYMAETSRHTFHGMQEGLQPGYTLSGTTMMVPPMPRAEAVLQSLRSKQVVAAAFFGFGYLPYPDSFYEAELIHNLAGEIPVVLVGKEHPFLKLDTVLCDPAPQMLSFLEECFASGKRRFAYFGAEDAQPHLEHRVAAYQEFLLSKGLAWNRAEMRDLPGDQAVIQAILAREPEVVVASTTIRAQSLVVEAQRLGRVPGEDLHILCFAGSPDEVRAIAPYVNVILLEEEEVGRCVVHRLLNRLEGTDKPAPVTRRVPGRLIRPGKLKFD